MKIIVGATITNWIFSRLAAFDNRMAYFRGLQRLGHEMYFMGNVDSRSCYNSNYNPVGFEEWEGRYRFELMAKSYGMWPYCCLIYNHGESTHGMAFSHAI